MENAIEMITKEQREYIKGLVKEAMNENSFFENLGLEKKKDDAPIEDRSKNREENESKKKLVLKWLDSAQELHSVLAYKLWPNLDDDSARSIFSKKYRGEDSNGDKYTFDDEEINRLYNMRDNYIESASLDK